MEDTLTRIALKDYEARAIFTPCSVSGAEADLQASIRLKMGQGRKNTSGGVTCAAVFDQAELGRLLQYMSADSAFASTLRKAFGRTLRAMVEGRAV